MQKTVNGEKFKTASTFRYVLFEKQKRIRLDYINYPDGTYTKVQKVTEVHAPIYRSDRWDRVMIRVKTYALYRSPRYHIMDQTEKTVETAARFHERLGRSVA